MRYQKLDDWLRWQETLHPQAIELGLERIRQVFQRLHPEPPPFTVITIGGTNGKGSTVAILESVFNAAGYKTAAYTSPHLLRYNERIRIEGRDASDAQICQAFQRVDEARGEVSLTYFEFGTLAALDLFYQNTPDIVLLEVGLGGRLDAVNIIDSDVAVITSIGLDHTDWLGNDRESIAYEKAGIMRCGRPVVCSDSKIPQAIISESLSVGSELYCLGREFSFETGRDNWFWNGPNGERQILPYPKQADEHQLRNAAGAMMVLSCLAERHPVSYQAVLDGLQKTQITGRQQLIKGKHIWVFDVAHNEQSACALADMLGKGTDKGKTHAIIGILRDKDIKSILLPMLPYITSWRCVDLAVPRGASAGQIRDELKSLTALPDIHCYKSVQMAMQELESCIPEGDRIVVFGSFYTVAEALHRGV